MEKCSTVLCFVIAGCLFNPDAQSSASYSGQCVDVEASILLRKEHCKFIDPKFFKERASGEGKVSMQCKEVTMQSRDPEKGICKFCLRTEIKQGVIVASEKEKKAGKTQDEVFDSEKNRIIAVLNIALLGEVFDQCIPVFILGFFCSKRDSCEPSHARDNYQKIQGIIGELGEDADHLAGVLVTHPVSFAKAVGVPVPSCTGGKGKKSGKGKESVDEDYEKFVEDNSDLIELIRLCAMGYVACDFNTNLKALVEDLTNFAKIKIFLERMVISPSNREIVDFVVKHPSTSLSGLERFLKNKKFEDIAEKIPDSGDCQRAAYGIFDDAMSSYDRICAWYDRKKEDTQWQEQQELLYVQRWCERDFASDKEQSRMCLR